MSFFDQLLVTLLPLVPKPIVHQVASNYVAGETIDDVIQVVKELNQDGMLATIDLLGEFIRQPSEAEQAADAYVHILNVIQDHKLQANVSIKLSQMGLLLDKELCYRLMKRVVAAAEETNNFVRIDMEDSACTSDTIAIYLRLRQDSKQVGIVLQAYLRRTLGDVRHLIDERAGHFRLCKGIYVEPRALAFKDRELVNRNYALVLEEMIKHKAYVGIATHDERLVWEAQRLIDQYQVPSDRYEFQMLLGVDPQLRQIILGGGHKLRVYVPFGQQWYAYSMRRLKENPTVARYVMQSTLRRFWYWLQKKPVKDWH
ncbi:MAG: proline dehydrogenase family protein [Cyanobacteria bacterium]|nr:proline dehydrogenase family protein [Cyanobacteriota bacterium]